MRSTYGQRAMMCEYFGWSYDQLVREVPWAVLLRMIIDAPQYGDSKDDEEELILTDDNAEIFANFISSKI